MPDAAADTSPLPAPRRRRRRSQHAGRAAHGAHEAARGLSRLFAALMALLSLGAALGLAWHYPLGRTPALLGVLASLLAARYFWRVWPGWMLALLPTLGLAPWTGWLWLEEWDLLLLASAAGAYLAWSGPHRQAPPHRVSPWRRELRWGGLTLALLLAWLVSQGLALALGLADAGGSWPQWWDGVHESGYSLRAFKPTLWVLWLAPLWLRAAQRAPQALTPSLLAGMAGCLGLLALQALRERWIYTGLTNFSSDYRTTGPFWEMHLGGATLDGMLALCLPFGLLLLLRQRRPRGFGLALVLLGLGLYACLSSFSRGLYVAALAGLGLTLLLWWRQRRLARRADPASSWLPGQVPREALPTVQRLHGLLGLGLLLALGVAVAWRMFPTSGYRGLLGLGGVLVLLLAQPSSGSAAASRLLSAGLGAVLALPLIGLSALLALAVDKAAYLAYTLAWLSSLGLARLAWRGGHPWSSPLGDALRATVWYWTLGLVGLVAWNWGGDPALAAAWWPLAILGLCWPLAQGGSLGAWLATLGWRERVGALGGLMVLLAVLAASGGGAYLGERLARSGKDFEGRLQHWSRALSLLDAREAWWFGLGLARFPALNQLNLPEAERVGDYRLQQEGAQTFLRLASGNHVLGAGEMLRLGQRIAAAPPGLRLRVQARSLAPAVLWVEVCERHLLYNGGCHSAQARLDRVDAEWHGLDIVLGGAGQLGLGNGRDLVFSLALSSPGRRVDLRGLSLRGADGRELLRNGDFARGLAHWFPTSDHHHMPWHLKSLPLHWLFEQGLAGLVLALGLSGLALARLTAGGAALHPLAPALAGALLGFGLVGVFDSLLDASRLAFLFYLLLLLSLGLRAPPAVVAKP